MSVSSYMSMGILLVVGILEKADAQAMVMPACLRFQL